MPRWPLFLLLFSGAFSLKPPFFQDGVASTPLMSRAARRKESAVKPGSVVDSHSSGMRVAAQLKRPTRKPCGPHVAAESTARFPIWSCSRWGLPCRGCCHPRGALLPHHFTLTGAARAALGGIFLLHFPWTRVPQVLPGTLPVGARTFLHPHRPKPAGAAAAWPTLSAHHTLV
jgi:hypothetical protein